MILHLRHFTTHSTSNRNQIIVIIRKMSKINRWKFHYSCAPRFLPNLHLKRPLSFFSFGWVNIALQTIPGWLPSLGIWVEETSGACSRHTEEGGACTYPTISLCRLSRPDSGSRPEGGWETTASEKNPFLSDTEAGLPSPLIRNQAHLFLVLRLRSSAFSFYCSASR